MIYDSILISNFVYYFSNGWQSLFQALVVEENLNVKTNSTVVSAERFRDELSGMPKVKITIRNKNELSFSEIFDRVIISVPHLANKFLQI